VEDGKPFRIVDGGNAYAIPQEIQTEAAGGRHWDTFEACKKGFVPSFGPLLQMRFTIADSMGEGKKSVVRSEDVGASGEPGLSYVNNGIVAELPVDGLEMLEKLWCCP